MLRDLGLCNNLSAGLYHVAPGFGFFTISVDLTEEALGCVDGIITLVFQVSYFFCQTTWSLTVLPLFLIFNS